MQEVSKRCGEDLVLHPLGNAPMAHIELPNSTRVFFYRFLHIEGVVQAHESVSEYAWLTKAELGEYLDAETAGLAEEMCGPFD